MASEHGDGVVIGTIVNSAGLTLAKVVSASGTARFADPGLGASPTWHGFAIDRSGIAFTDAISVVGDQRLRIDLHAMRQIEEGMRSSSWSWTRPEIDCPDSPGLSTGSPGCSNTRRSSAT
jgi:hypothetical protein